MTHQLYRGDDFQEGYKVVELELEDDLIKYLEARAVEEQCTVDDIIEQILEAVIQDLENKE